MTNTKKNNSIIINPPDLRMEEFSALFNQKIDKDKFIGKNVNMFTVAVKIESQNIILTNAERLANIFLEKEMHLYCPKYKKFDKENNQSLLISIDEIQSSNKKESDAIYFRQHFDQTIKPQTTIFVMYNQYSKDLNKTIRCSFTIGLSKHQDKNEYYYKNRENLIKIFDEMLNISLKIKNNKFV